MRLISAWLAMTVLMEEIRVPLSDSGIATRGFKMSATNLGPGLTFFSVSNI